mmetsp:Transcript_28557/g.60027  ORF Transcript_28557/g.60027 Transcript_28557/m.60027 type:complete len:129 (-) Transcript_28557:245-631(-)
MVRIDANGSVIKDDGTIAGGSGGASSSGSGGSGGGGRRLCRLPAYIDTFGFHLELKHFAVVLLFISMTMGSFGLGLFLLSLTIYTYYQRHSPSSSSGGGGGKGSRWKDGKAVGGNIKGVSDLPKPPKG